VNEPRWPERIPREMAFVASGVAGHTPDSCVIPCRAMPVAPPPTWLRVRASVWPMHPSSPCAAPRKRTTVRPEALPTTMEQERIVALVVGPFVMLLAEQVGH